MDDAEDIDADAEVDVEADADADAENDDDNDDNEENDEDDQDQDDTQGLFNESTQSQLLSKSDHSRPTLNANSSQTISTGPLLAQPGPNTTVTPTSPTPRLPPKPPSANPFRPTVRPEALTAPVYDIVPTIAAPHGTSINAITATSDMRWVFSGGSDGYIRKFNWVD